MITFLSALWFIRTAKVILFYLYLWQLKEYHIGRFLDHFRTVKGKQLLFNKLTLLKLVLLASFPVVPLLLFFVGAVFYIFETVKTLLDFLSGRLKKPVLTKKTLTLISVAILIEFLVLCAISLNVKSVVWVVFWLLIFDVLAPFIASVIVLLFQPISALARLQIIKKAKNKRAKFKDLLVIGIAGSYGKTSTKEFLSVILAEKYKVLKTKEHQNSEVGISQCILDNLSLGHEIFVCEMGAYNRGGIKLLCDIANPKIGILTGINEQHLATFGSLENTIKAKYELIESLPAEGTAFFNAKNKYCQELYEKTKIKKKLYGERATFTGEENILGAMAVASELGMTEEEISKALDKIENKIPGIQVKQGIGGFKIIDATYSANPTGVISHLEYLKALPGRKVIVMPCLIELGRASKAVHQKIGKKIGEVCDLAIITTKDRFKEIKEGAGDKAIFLEKPKEILEKIKNFCKEGDTMLLESRVPPELLRKLVINNQ